MWICYYVLMRLRSTTTHHQKKKKKNNGSHEGRMLIATIIDGKAPLL
jgi:hypothetical protein